MVGAVSDGVEMGGGEARPQAEWGGGWHSKLTESFP